MPLTPANPPSGLISEALIRRLFSSSDREHQLLMQSLGAPRNYRGVSGWPCESVSLHLAELRGERARDDWR